VQQTAAWLPFVRSGLGEVYVDGDVTARDVSVAVGSFPFDIVGFFVVSQVHEIRCVGLTLKVQIPDPVIVSNEIHARN
jgi:hypothetical protein